MPYICTYMHAFKMKETFLQFKRRDRISVEGGRKVWEGRLRSVNCMGAVQY